MITLKRFILIVILLLMFTGFVCATKPTIQEVNTDVQDIKEEEPSPKSSNSIKAYSNGSIYKETAPKSTTEPTGRRNAGNATNDDDPGFPGDPGQLPVGDGFMLLLGAGLIYFLIRKNHFKKYNHE